MVKDDPPTSQTPLSMCDNVKEICPIPSALKTFTVPSFKRFLPSVIDEYVQAFRKVADNHELLLEGDCGNDAVIVDESGDG